MISFKEYSELQEKLIIVGKKAYPKFGNVVIMAGGAASGKGFVKDKLLGIEGFVYDVDELKKMSSKSEIISKRVRDEFGVELKDLSSKLNDPKNVSILHDIISDIGLNKRKLNSFYLSALLSPKDRKPNIIFDVTLKNFDKLKVLTDEVKTLGYDPTNIHLVWVVNDIEVAKKQNELPERGRVVPSEILVNTHRGAAATMYDIINTGKDLKKYLDGDIAISFNKVGVDTELKVSGKGGSYIKDSNYFHIKKSGQDVMPLEKISKDVRSKIKQYVPKDIQWV